MDYYSLDSNIVYFFQLNIGKMNKIKTIEVITAIKQLISKYKKADNYDYEDDILDLSLGTALCCSLCILFDHQQPDDIVKDEKCKKCINSVFDDDIQLYPCVARIYNYELDWTEDKNDFKNLVKFWTDVNKYLKLLQSEEFKITAGMKKAVLNIAKPYKK